jgi:hypothetical protein
MEKKWPWMDEDSTRSLNVTLVQQGSINHDMAPIKNIIPSKCWRLMQYLH